MESKNVSKVKSAWQAIYWEIFKKRVNFHDLLIPAVYDPAKHFCVIVDGDVLPGEAIHKLNELSDVHRQFKELDQSLNNQRFGNKSYAIIFERNFEADLSTKMASAQELAELEMDCINFKERLLLEIYCLREASTKLDTQRTTLCSGSRLDNGRVPIIYYHNEHQRIYIDSCSPTECAKDLCARLVVAVAC